jgi:polysaccharide deacetylase family sporulation protein PdaB
MKVSHWIFGGVAIAAVALIGVEQHFAEDTLTVTHVPTSQKIIALTIDDGPNSKVTPEILNILKAKHVRATFFVLGENVEHYPKLLAQEVKDGHEIGIHTYSHPSLTKLGPQKIAEEMDKSEKAIAANAPKPTLFRPPGGFYNHQVIEAAHQKGYTVVLWSVDPKDWSCPPTSQVVERVLHDSKPGGIILLHDGQYPLPTPQALGTIIDRLREQGYEFVTVSELLQYNEVRHTFRFLDFFR